MAVENKVFKSNKTKFYVLYELKYKELMNSIQLRTI